MNWWQFIQDVLGTEASTRWQGVRVQKVVVSRRRRVWQIHLQMSQPVPREELSAVESALTAQVDNLKEVTLLPQLTERPRVFRTILQQRKDELSSYLFPTSDVSGLTGVEWVVNDDIELVVNSRQRWERLMEDDICSRMADWFKQEYGIYVLVKCTCTEPLPAPGSPDFRSTDVVPEMKGKVNFISAKFISKPVRKHRKKGERQDNRQVVGEPIPISQVEEGMRQAVVEGEIVEIEKRSLKENRRLSTYYLTDYHDTLMVKHFYDAGQEESIVVGDWLRMQGSVRYDEFEKETVLFLQAWQAVEPPVRQDRAAEKRVELHAHTVMSTLDGVTRIHALIERAAAWGQPAIAITDHGVIQAFPEAYQVARQAGIKVIYGMEGYLVDELKQRHAYHILILARNQEGLRNLYHLVSLSHLDNFYRQPRIRREDLLRYRSGLILGTACQAGELITAYLEKQDEEQLTSIASFYDFIEVQPAGNNEFLVRDGRMSSTEVQEMNRFLVNLGEKLGKPVVATGDVHFLDPHHEMFRRILQANKGFEDAEAQAPLYLRTTEEMLEEFAWLGPEKAHQIVVESSRQIAAQVESLQPIPDGNFFPSIAGAEKEISGIVWQNAHRIYGTELPERIARRLQQELDSIISNNFSVLYLIAHKLVEKSNQDGYLVGSRGSVGSSLVAYLTGITEVNPLSPHYRCPQCCHTRFVDDGSVDCGVDLPEEICPRCGTVLARDGFSIPFETFLGFEGDKVPDIDLNFSGEYQARAHQYVEEVFGQEHVFRAGTINTLARASAIGMVRNYAEKTGSRLRKGEVLRLAAGITGVKRTSGQHPGGLIVVPQEKDIHQFTPLNYPANKADSGIITTHFDYHSINERLVKLDILGHDDPTMIKALEDLTGHSALDIPLNEDLTMKLFSGVEPLEVTPEDIRSPIGTYGIPEFGTRFVRQMLEVTRPASFSELIRISGLSHGTDVWLNNAQDLIKNGTTDLKQVIATRDDIMTFLIRQGLPKKQAFKIMESVRKGRGLVPDEVKAMKEAGVPLWYIESCQKIKYMFPRAHAVAYVMMAFRIAFYKVYYPREFYAGFFSIRAEDFDAEVSLRGYDAIRNSIENIEKMGSSASPKERKLLPVLEVALEMYARGFQFLPVHLYDSHATRFLVCPQGLILPFSSLSGVGDKAAESIVKAREQGEFVSVEDLQLRSGISRAVIDILKQSGCLDSLPETSQLSLFG